MPRDKEKSAGPPTAGGPAFLVVGKVRRPHGVRGDVVVEIYTDFPEKLIPEKVVFLGERHDKLIITRRRLHNEGLLLGFEGVSSPEQAGRFRNQMVSIASTETPELPVGQYYFHELINLKVVDEDGNILGKLTEVLETGANDVYVVHNSNGHELLIPAIPDVLLSVDLALKTIKVHLPPGLDDE
ncbi:MAG: ribosome maturation factor RimM [Anaerolineales bacterium]